MQCWRKTEQWQLRETLSPDMISCWNSEFYPSITHIKIWYRCPYSLCHAYVNYSERWQRGSYISFVFYSLFLWFFFLPLTQSVVSVKGSVHPSSKNQEKYIFSLTSSGPQPCRSFGFSSFILNKSLFNSVTFGKRQKTGTDTWTNKTKPICYQCACACLFVLFCFLCHLGELTL